MHSEALNTHTEDTDANKATANLIEVSGLINQFGDNLVHDNLQLKVRRGEILGVVGGSGTGKSVLLRSIIGLLKPVAGDINLFGQTQKTVLNDYKKGKNIRHGVMFQDGALFSSLTVRENIKLAVTEHFKLSDDLLHTISCMKIALVGLPAHAATLYPASLSGGMRKRAGLARALALEPELLFLDEPTAGLDPVSADGIDQLLKTLRDTLGLTVFLVTHDLDTLHAICDRVAVLAEHKVLTIGPLDEVAKFDHPWVQEYFSGPRGRTVMSQYTTSEA